MIGKGKLLHMRSRMALVTKGTCVGGLRFASSFAPLEQKAVDLLGNSYHQDEWSNLSPRIIDKLGRSLHRQPDHPLRIIKQRINQYFTEKSNVPFQMLDQYSPIVTPHMNFDTLLIPEDHVSRGTNDTYYVNKSHLLRTHTSAHQAQTMSSGVENFLVCGDVYRRDEIDASHYPVFHQIEGVRLFGADELCARGLKPDVGLFEKGAETPTKQPQHTQAAASLVEQDLKQTLEGLVRHLFGRVELRWVDTYFPFTHPSFEIEVFFNGDWLEVLGCGVIRQDIIEKSGIEGKVGWAFGLGLERLAMVLFQINDIRLFWSEDERFLSQFSVSGLDESSRGPLVFKPFSKHPPCYKDISFWIGSEQFTDNNFFEVVRGEAGDIAERVDLVDDFVHPKTNKRSKCFRITFRSMDRTVTNDEINGIQERIRQRVHQELDVELR